MQKVLKFIDQMSIWIGKSSSYVILLIVAICGFEVTMRYVFTRPTVWGSEAMVYGCAYLYALGASWTLQAGRHVKIDVLYTHLSPRWQKILDCLTYPFFLFYMGTMAWVGSKFASESFALRETSGTPWDPPVYPIKIIFVVAVVLLMFQGSAKFVRDLHYAINGKDL